MNWISVKDRLPDNSWCSCLVITRGHGISIKYFAFGEFFSRVNDAYFTFREKEYNEKSPIVIGKPLKTVTHWIILPDPPRD